MLRVLRGLPSLQRKLLYVILASALVLLIYLLITSHEGQFNVHEKDKISAPRPSSSSIAPQNEVEIKESESSKNSEAGKLTIDVNDFEGNHLDIDDVVAGNNDVDNADGVDKNNGNNHVGNAHVDDNNKQPAKHPYTGPTNDRQRAVVEAFQHAWQSYKKYAWGHDELKPLSRTWHDWFGVGLSIVDSLDTIHIMGLTQEFQLGRNWVAENLTLSSQNEVLLFEIVIRALGGLLSAYHLSGDEMFLQKADELGEVLMPCFNGPTAIPCRVLHMKGPSPRYQEISTAESGTIQLEFRDLSRSTKKSKYEEAAMATSQHIHQLEKLDGLVACFINANTGQFRKTSTVSVGASADSYYEYLLKQWIQTGKKIDWLKQDYLDAVDGIKKHLYKQTEPNHWAFVGAYHSMVSHHFRMEMEHLACFLPGTLALGYIAGAGNQDHLDMAAELTHTCYMMYKRMPTGLSPEVAYMNINSNGKEDILMSSGAHYNLQRPETVESLFYMYRATGEDKYREWGWEIFQAFEKYTRVPYGYASIDSVHRPDNVGHRDKMETFYLAETLKYLYLLFSDNSDLLPLDKFVINTEAHPLPVYDS